MHCRVHKITYEIFLPKMFNPIVIKFLDLTWFSRNTRGKGIQGCRVHDSREKQSDKSLMMGTLKTTGWSLRSELGRNRS